MIFARSTVDDPGSNRLAANALPLLSLTPGAEVDFDRAKEESNAKGPIIIHLDTKPLPPLPFPTQGMGDVMWPRKQ
jgi:hypothetical protein